MGLPIALDAISALGGSWPPDPRGGGAARSHVALGQWFKRRREAGQ